MAKTIDEEINSKFADDKHRFLLNLMFTSNWIKNKFTEFIKPYGVSHQQFNILRILRGAKDWVNMNDVKHRMIEKSPNATRLCDKLVDKKLIERRRSEDDRRVVYLKITELGLQLLKKIDDVDEKPFDNFIQNITNSEAKIASDIIDKFRS